MHLAPLRNLPPAVQLLFFLMFWFACSFLMMAVQPVVFDLLNIPAKDMAALLKMDKPPAKGILAIMVLTQVFSFLIPAVLFMRLVDPQPAKIFSFRKIIPKDFWWTVLLSLGTILLMMGLSGILQHIEMGTTADKLQENRGMTEAAFYEMTTIPQFLLNLFIVALLPAVCEELFFRGVLQRLINTFLKRPLFSILLTAILFASMHGTIYNLIPIIVGGVILGWVYHITGNMWLNILLHFLNNGLQLLIVFITGASQENDLTPIYQALPIFAVGLVLVVLLIKTLRKKNIGFPENWGMHFKPYSVDLKYHED